MQFEFLKKPKTIQEANERSEYIKGMESLRSRHAERPLSTQHYNRKQGRKKHPERIVAVLKKRDGTPITYRYHIQNPYDFLQYIKVVMEWGMKTLGCTKSQLDLLLYLYPLGIFSSRDYSFCRHQINVLGWNEFHIKNFVKKGWIKKSDVKTGFKRQLYNLTDATKGYIKRMHEFSIGAKPLPYMEKFPNLVSSQKIVDDYYVTTKDAFE